MPTQIEGDRQQGEADSQRPVSVGGVGRTTNPTAVSDGGRLGLFQDVLGRVVVILQQVRNLVVVGNISLTTGVETTLITAVAATYHDLVLVSGANSSDKTVRIDIRDTTGGTVRTSLQLPASNMATMLFEVPYPQNAINTNWTAQMEAGTSGTTVRVFAQAVKNV